MDDLPLVSAYASPAWTAADRSSAEFTITLSDPAPVDITMPYAVGGTAIPGTDHTSISDTVVNGVLQGEVTIPAGQTKAEVEVETLPSGATGDRTVTLRPLGAGVTLPGGSFFAYGIGPGSLATVTIADDTPPLPELTVSDAVANEGDSETFKVPALASVFLDRSGHGPVYFG